MGFQFPDAFVLLILLPPTLWIFWRGTIRSRKIILAFRERPTNKWHAIVRLVLVAIFILSLVITGARPYVESNQTGTFLFLVDVTRSMSARYSCAEPTFLERAKILMKYVITEIPEAKFGIVAFDRLAFPITPITFDRNYLEQAIQYGLKVGFTYDATATNIENALSAVANKKARLPEFYKDVSYVILLSDGHIEGNYQARLRIPFTELQRSGIKIISLGVGNPGETPVPMVTDRGICQKRLYTDINGKTIYIPFRDDVLSYISAATQGVYFGETEIASLVSFLRSNGLEDLNDKELKSINQKRDISGIFLYLSLASLIGIIVHKRFS